MESADGGEAGSMKGGLGLDFVFQDWLDPRMFTDHRAQVFRLTLEGSRGEHVPISIRQGAFVHTKEDDRTGAVVWDDAVMLCRYLSMNKGIASSLKGKTVVDLGCGSGFLGIAVAATCGANVVLTDRHIMKELNQGNIEENSDIIKIGGGSVDFETLSWGQKLGKSLAEKAPVDFVLASGCVYHEEANPLLLRSLRDLSCSTTVTYFAIDFRFDVSDTRCSEQESQYAAPVVSSFLKLASESGFQMEQIPRADLGLENSFVKDSVRLYRCTFCDMNE